VPDALHDVIRADSAKTERMTAVNIEEILDMLDDMLDQKPDPAVFGRA
jgi:hypothetical protein